MKTNWIYKKPIDLEYKQYVLLDYYQKIQKEFDEFKLYPSFQQVTLHLANLNLAKTKHQYLTTKNEIIQPDEEILLSEIKYHSPKIDSEDDKNVVEQVVEFSREKLTQLFLIGKSLWEIVNDSISLKLIKNYEQLMTGNGYFKFIYEDKMYLYEYKIKSTDDNYIHSQKCYVNEIYCGEKKGTYKVTLENTTFKNADIKKEDLVKLLPIFEVSIDNKFPLEETILPLIKRKISNYVMQTVKINEIKEINKDGN